MTRVLIAGGPRVGKTTLSRSLATRLGVEPRSTDELVGRVAFGDAAGIVASWLEQPGPWVIEGVTVVRALRHWLADHRSGLPCDRLLWSDTVKASQTPQQAVMAKGVATVWSQVEGELSRRGLAIEPF